MFMASLEGKARSWYEILLPSCIYFLKDFHTMYFERYIESFPSLILVQNYCKHVDSFIENLENVYGDDEFMDDEIMEALYENPFQQHKESLEDTCQDAQEISQEAKDLCTVENGVRQGLILDLLAAEDGMKENRVPISDYDKVKLAIPDLDSDCDAEDYVVPNPMKESSIVEITFNEENKVIDSSVLIPSEQIL